MLLQRNRGNENNGGNLWTNENVHATNPFQGKVKGIQNYKTNKNSFSQLKVLIVLILIINIC